MGADAFQYAYGERAEMECCHDRYLLVEWMVVCNCSFADDHPSILQASELQVPVPTHLVCGIKWIMDRYRAIRTWIFF